MFIRYIASAFGGEVLIEPHRGLLYFAIPAIKLTIPKTIQKMESNEMFIQITIS